MGLVEERDLDQSISEVVVVGNPSQMNDFLCGGTIIGQHRAPGLIHLINQVFGENREVGVPLHQGEVFVEKILDLQKVL